MFGIVVLSGTESKSCLGLRTVGFCNLQTDWQSGLVWEGRQVLSWAQSLLAYMSFKWIERVSLIWKKDTFCLGRRIFGVYNLQMDCESCHVLEEGKSCLGRSM